MTVLNEQSSADLDGFLHITAAQRVHIAQKFNSLLSTLGQVSRVPGMTENLCLVASASNPRKPHLIDATFKNGKVACDCVGYKVFKICAHALAGARFCGVFPEYCGWHNEQSAAPRLDAIVEHDQDRSVGQKKTRKTQQRIGSKKPKPPVTSIVTVSGTLSTDHLQAVGNGRKPTVQPAPYTWEVHFLSCCHYKVKTCFGCRKDIKHPNGDAFSALDLIAVSHMERTYFDKNEQVEKDSGIGNVYFHLSLDCIKKKVTDFQPKELMFPEGVGEKLTLQHKRRIQAAVEIQFHFCVISPLVCAGCF